MEPKVKTKMIQIRICKKIQTNQPGNGSNTSHGPSDPLLGTDYLDRHTVKYNASPRRMIGHLSCPQTSGHLSPLAALTSDLDRLTSRIDINADRIDALDGPRDYENKEDCQRATCALVKPGPGKYASFASVVNHPAKLTLVLSTTFAKQGIQVPVKLASL